MRVPGRRFFCRYYFILLILSLICFLILLYRIQNHEVSIETDNWIHVNLASGQRQFVDSKSGMRVIIGHYLESPDSNDVGENMQNLTREIIDSNLFDPRPNEGKDGNPVLIKRHEMKKMKLLYKINRFNLLASDRIPLNRSLHDVRKKRCTTRYNAEINLPTASIIIVFHNEAWSTLLRTVHSVIDRSPLHLLREIILVDDFSDRAFLKSPLEEYVKKLSVPAVVLRQARRGGLVNARLRGARHAEGSILVFLDAHCEVTKGWLESLIIPIVDNRKNVICPIIDIISDDNFAYIRSFELHWGAFNWNLHFRWYTLGTSEFEKRKKDLVAPFRTPVMAGGLFAINKDFFFEIGSYDEQMDIWGGENLELSFRIWQCGGQVLIAPCSHVGHLFRKSSPYTFPRPGGVTDTLFANLARVALVWMDDWADFFFKFNPQAEKLRDQQSVRSRLNLRKRLHCKSFSWYLKNIWPENFLPADDRFFGRIVHISSDKCIQRPNGQGSIKSPIGQVKVVKCISLVVPTLLQMFVMTPEGFIVTDESVCFDANLSNAIEYGSEVKIMACTQSERQKWIYHETNNTVVHKLSGLCLNLIDKKNGQVLKLSKCNLSENIKWKLESHSWK